MTISDKPKLKIVFLRDGGSTKLGGPPLGLGARGIFEGSMAGSSVKIPEIPVSSSTLRRWGRDWDVVMFRAQADYTHILNSYQCK